MKRRGLFVLILAVCLIGPAPASAAGFVDDSGRRIVIKRPFKRIISLYGAHTENLFSLGLDRQIIGVSVNDDFPAAVARKKKFSYRDDAERLLSARPDLVLIRPMIYRGHRGLVDQLVRAGVTVVSLQPRSIKDMLVYWRRLGMLTGRPRRAQAMIARFKREIARLRARVAGVPVKKRPRVYFEAIHRRMKTFAPGAMALFVLEAAGGRNVAADARSVRGTNIAYYGLERILSHADEIDVFLAQTGPMNRVTVARIKATSGFQAIKAVREGRIYLIDEKVVSRPTLRLLQGVARVQALLYPGRNKKPSTARSRP